MALQEGKFWNVQEVLREEPASAGAQGLHDTWLARSEHATVKVVQGQPPQLPGPDLLHVHKEHDEIAYVVEADTDFRLGEFTKRLKPGDVIFIPAGVVHGPTGGERVVVVSIYAPFFDPEHPDQTHVS